MISALAALVLAGCGSSQRQQAAPPAATQAPAAVTSTEKAQAPAPKAHPQAIQPVAGSGNQVSAAPSQPSAVSVGPSSSSSSSGGLAQPVSDAVIRKELAASGLSANSDQATLTPEGLAIPPVSAPATVQAVISAGNEIAHL